MASLQAGEMATGTAPHVTAPGSGPAENKRARGPAENTNGEPFLPRRRRRSPGSDGDPYMAETAAMRQCGHQSEGEGSI